MSDLRLWPPSGLCADPKQKHAASGIGLRGDTSPQGLPAGMQNGPPGQSSVLRAGRGAYKVGAPGMMYRLSKLGPIGRPAGDLVPGLGELLLYGQDTLAVSDGARAAYDCGSKVK